MEVKKTVRAIEWFYQIIKCSCNFWWTIITNYIIFGLIDGFQSLLQGLIEEGNLSGKIMIYPPSSKKVGKYLSLSFFALLGILGTIITMTEYQISSLLILIIIVVAFYSMILVVLGIHYVLLDEPDEKKRIYLAFLAMIKNFSLSFLLVGIILIEGMSLYINLIIGVFFMPGILGKLLLMFQIKNSEMG